VQSLKIHIYSGGKAKCRFFDKAVKSNGDGFQLVIIVIDSNRLIIINLNAC